MLEFVNSWLYFLQDENNFINPLLQVGTGSGEKSTGSGSGGQKIYGSDRIRILVHAGYNESGSRSLELTRVQCADEEPVDKGDD